MITQVTFVDDFITLRTFCCGTDSDLSFWGRSLSFFPDLVVGPPFEAGGSPFPLQVDGGMAAFHVFPKVIFSRAGELAGIHRAWGQRFLAVIVSHMSTFTGGVEEFLRANGTLVELGLGRRMR